MASEQVMDGRVAHQLKRLVRLLADQHFSRGSLPSCQTRVHAGMRFLTQTGDWAWEEVRKEGKSNEV